MLRILNSQSRQKEDFKPVDPAGKRAGIYTCGPTVYDSCHLGHARAAITPDMVRRYLEHKGYLVRYVTNFTDIDDKIIKEAHKQNRDWRALTAQYIDEFHRVMLSLNVKPADVYPRATDHIPEMIEIVGRLMAKGNAYAASDGDVYFNTASFPRYGALSGRNLDEEEAGLSGRISAQRMAVKKNAGDFVLWKLNKNDSAELAQGGERVPRWSSPWGDGRPGWHLECSAMSRKYLGVPFDIHAGGQDLLFPHHEDEKAQTECAYHEELGERDSVRYWVHNAFVTVGDVKLSKSLGNARWLREMIWPDGPYDPMSVRMMMLSSHYRSPLAFEGGVLDEASARLERIYNTLETLGRALGADAEKDAPPADKVMQAFEKEMDDDFNTAGALGVVFELVTEANKALAGGKPDAQQLLAYRSGIRTMLSILGIRTQRAAGKSSGDSEKLVELLLQTRKEARQLKQFALSDKIRAELKSLGYEIEDLPDGRSVAKKK